MTAITRGRAPEPLIDVSTVLRYGFGDIVEPLIAVLDGELWKDVGHDTLASLVYTPMPDGWEVTKPILLHFLSASPLMCDRVEQAMPDSDVRPFVVGKVPTAGKHGGQRTQGNNGSLPKSGSNAADAAIARLKRDRPDLAEQVAAGEKSPHAAAVEAGFRTKTITVPLDPERAAATLRRQFKGEAFQRLLNELNEEYA